MAFASEPWQRVLARVEIADNGCWLYRGLILEKGYPQLSVRVDGHTVTMRPHRIVYEAIVGPIDDGLELDHQCHTRDTSCRGGPTCAHRRCVNPEHVEPVTGAENRRRAWRNRPRGERSGNGRKTHCPQGHPYDEANTRVYKGKRQCVTCNTERNTARRRAA